MNATIKLYGFNTKQQTLTLTFTAEGEIEKIMERAAEVQELYFCNGRANQVDILPHYDHERC
jgi:hypothetical protein